MRTFLFPFLLSAALTLGGCGSGEKIEVRGFTYVPIPAGLWDSSDSCGIFMSVGNHTKHRLRSLELTAEANPSGTYKAQKNYFLSVGDIEANGTQTGETLARTIPCSRVKIVSHKVSRCEIEGMPEGDCMKLVRFIPLPDPRENG